MLPMWVDVDEVLLGGEDLGLSLEIDGWGVEVHPSSFGSGLLDRGARRDWRDRRRWHKDQVVSYSGRIQRDLFCRYGNIEVISVRD